MFPKLNSSVKELAAALVLNSSDNGKEEQLQQTGYDSALCWRWQQ